MSSILLARAGSALLLAVFTSVVATAAELAPTAPGRYAVGSTNFEVNVPAAGAMVDYLKGKATRTQSLYVADLLKHRDAALATDLEVPQDPALFRSQAGARIPLVLYVLYPTTPDNPRKDYVFPYKETGDNVFPHMQRAGDRPIFARTGERYPLVVYSHGYEGHGLWDLEQLKVLASHGYIVVDIFHGDGRAASFDANLALRPIEFRRALDFVLNHPDFAGAIDPARIGASGSSFGGYTVLRVTGGRDPAAGQTADADPRIKAVFGLVPFMGGVMGFWPLGIDEWVFGKDYAGLRSVRVPFLAVYGGKDTNVKPASVEAGVAQMSGPASAVKLDGEQHLLSKNVWSDVYTWEVLFFDTWLRGDEEARRLLYSGTSVRGGVNDHRTLQHAARCVGPEGLK